MRIGICSGYFNPVHSGHIDYLNDAKSKCDYLIVGVNSDTAAIRKHGKLFMDWDERSYIISNLKAVDAVLAFDDSDGSANDLINKIAMALPTAGEIIFMNGGDRTKENIPEMVKYGTKIKFLFGVGGDHKRNSSSTLLQNWNKK